MLDEKQIKDLNDVNKEILQIANEIERISVNVRNDFSGIGNSRCADCLHYTGQRILDVSKFISKTDVNNLSDDFKKSHDIKE